MDDVDPDGIFPPKLVNETATQKAARFVLTVEPTHSDDDGIPLGPRSDRTSLEPCFNDDDPRYSPPDGTDNVYRTVLMTNVPPATRLADMTSLVRGGPLESIKLCDTTSITGSLTALVVFLLEASARTYVAFRQRHPARLEGHLLPTALLTSCTTPTPRRALDAIAAFGCTRCLRVAHVPSHLNAHAVAALLGRGDGAGVGAHGIASMRLDARGVWHLSFASVDAAGWALGRFRGMSAFEGARVEFALDPCAQHVMTLVDHAAARGGDGSGACATVAARLDVVRRSASGVILPYDDGEDGVGGGTSADAPSALMSYGRHIRPVVRRLRKPRDLDAPQPKQVLGRRTVRYHSDDEEMLDMADRPPELVGKKKQRQMQGGSPPSSGGAPSPRDERSIGLVDVRPFEQPAVTLGDGLVQGGEEDLITMDVDIPPEATLIDMHDFAVSFASKL